MINLFVVHSQIEEQNSVKKRTNELVRKLINNITDLDFKGYFNQQEYLQKYFQDNADLKNATIILNTSGGTEQLIDLITKKVESPVLIISDSARNSFASAMEAYSYLKDSYAVKIFYAENDLQKIEETEKFTSVVNSIAFINNAHFGLIGNPSDWLLTSREFTNFGNFNTRFTKFEVDRIVNEVNKVAENDAKTIVESWTKNYDDIHVDNTAMIDSAKVYLAIRKFVEENNLQVLSIRCFDLLQYNYTACMGLSICNDEGITSGCEGDIPTTFTMLIAQQLTGEPVWMANPSSVKKDKNQIIFAHCTVPSKFLKDEKEAGLTTHMESGLSTAIRGELKKSVVTIMRIGNGFDRIVAVTGKIIDSDMQEENLCRTQAVVEIDGDVNKWIETAMGNHQVIVYGNIIRELEYFCDFSGVELIRI
ncbi:MAG: hypothetical protein U5K00_19290 [Melioribacteraceae bacterium]|nr:hypothetical protein [Melioribacteraceae bacterium]